MSMPNGFLNHTALQAQTWNAASVFPLIGHFQKLHFSKINGMFPALDLLSPKCK